MGPLRRTLVLISCLLLAQSGYSFRRRLASVSGIRSLSSPDYAVYHRKDDLLREVVEIVKANPGYMQMDVLVGGDGDYKPELKVVTVEPGGFSNRQHEKVRVLLDFGEHGREFISSELGLLLLRTLAGGKGPAAGAGQAGSGGLAALFPGQPERARELQRLLEGTVIKILPMENEAGRALVEGGKLCERKNGRGVDPNRNWPLDWGRKEPDYNPEEEYPGTAPFSEPEVKHLSQLAAGFSPQIWVNVHSGMEAMFVPWDHRAEVPQGAEASLGILKRIQSEVLANTSTAVGSGGETVGYLAHGTATDYMWDALHVPLAFTWEIYGDFSAHFDDCFRMFNPLDAAGVQAVLQRWLLALMRLIELAPTHPALQDAPSWQPGFTSNTSSVSSSSSSSSGSNAGGAEVQQQQGPQVQGNGQPTLDVTAGSTRGTGGTSTSSTARVEGGSSSNNSSGSSSMQGSSSSNKDVGDSEQQQQEQKPQSQKVVIAGEDEPSRVAPVVGSNSGGSDSSAASGLWSSGGRTLFGGMLAGASVLGVGVLAFRFLASGGDVERRGSRGTGYQTV